MSNADKIHRVIFGTTGCGKTEKAKRIIETYERSITVNTLCEDDFNHGIQFDNFEELKKFWLKTYRNKFRIIYNPEHGDEEKTCSEVEELCGFAYLCGNVALLVEEMNVLFETKRVPATFNKLILAGRKRGVEIIGVAQCTTGFGPKFRSQCKEAYIFHIHEETYIDVLQNLIGRDGAKKLPLLEDYQYLYWTIDNPGTYEIKKDTLPVM